MRISNYHTHDLTKNISDNLKNYLSNCCRYAFSVYVSFFFYFGSLDVFGISIANAQTESCQPHQISEKTLVNNFFAANSYEPVFKNCFLNDGKVSITAIRLLDLMQKKYVLYVNNSDLTTDLIPESCLSQCVDSTTDLTHDSAENQILPNYYKALQQTTVAPFPLHGDGLRHDFSKERQVFLTVDLCPSHLPMDQELFNKIRLDQNSPSADNRKPVPVAISMSGYWLLRHTEDFQHLLKLQRDNKIDITWVNHSYSHPYVKGLSNDHNFLLKDGINLADEVFKNEKLFLQNGIIPSVFFRFPGLISNENDIETLRRWGLIPLAADAWLANGETAKVGSIILVHANGNEPKGLVALYKLMLDWPELKSLFAKINRAFAIN